MRARLVLLALLTSSPAWAANYNYLGAGKAGESLFTLDAPDLLPEGAVSIRGTYSLVDDPVVCELKAGIRPGDLDGEPVVRAAAIRSAHLAAAALAWGVHESVELSIGLPLMLADVNLGAANLACGSRRGLTGLHLGVNDPELRVRWSLWRTEPLLLSVKAVARPPIAAWFTNRDEPDVFGDRLGSVLVGVTGGVRWPGLLGVAELGLDVRPLGSPLAGAFVGQGLVFGAGVEADIAWGFAATAELSGRLLEMRSPNGAGELQLPLEALAGLQYRTGSFEVTLGVGGGLIAGVGAPSARVVSSVSYLFGADFDPSRSLFSLRDLLKEEPAPSPRRRTTRPGIPRPPAPDCPDPRSPDARLLWVPGCPEPPREQAPAATDDDDALVAEVLGECPVCGRRDAHHHELALVVHVFFAHDVAELSEREKSRLLREVQSPPRTATLVAVHVRAHADASGADAYNQSLSARRAAHVADVLVSAGIPAGLVSLEAKGARDPLVSDELDEANRRVRVELHYRIERETK